MIGFLNTVFFLYLKKYFFASIAYSVRGIAVIILAKAKAVPSLRGVADMLVNHKLESPAACSVSPVAGAAHKTRS